MSFKQFLINESKQVFSTKVGGILNGLQTLKDDIPQMGNTARSKYVKDIVSQIRRILTDSIDDTMIGELKLLQKIGVSLLKSIETPGSDIEGILVSSIEEIEKLLDKLKNPINNVGNEIQDLN